tara:strand:- start:284 stop:1129 length:846 start_codon:yes stop_codon:yes gene_type:complete
MSETYCMLRDPASYGRAICRFFLPAALLLGVSQAHAGLVLHYTFDETSGTTTADSSGGGHTGTLTNMSGTEWTTGKFGGGLSFDGTNDYILPPTAAHPTGSELSVAFWSKGAIGLSKNYIVQSAAGGRVLAVHLPWGTGGGSIIWDVGDGSSYDRIVKTASAAEVQGSWVHWAFTKNATTGLMNIYHNGALWHSGGGNARSMPATNTFDYLSIGGAPGTFSWEGTMDDFRMYDHALSAGEVSALGAVSTAPEPASVFASLGLLSAAGCGLREWRRRKKKAA